MRAHELILGLEELLRAAAGEFMLPSSLAAYGPASVHVGGLPTDEAATLPERFPFALIQWTGGDIEQPSAQWRSGLDGASIIVGVYSPASPREAELICAAYADFLRGVLMRSELVASRFRLQLPLACQKPAPEEKQHQYHLFTISARWEYSLPGPPVADEGDYDA